MSVGRVKLRIEERAEAEARAAYLWYLDRNSRAAERFQSAFEECINAIADVEWWWGRTDVREQILGGVRVEPLHTGLAHLDRLRRYFPSVRVLGV